MKVSAGVFDRLPEGLHLFDLAHPMPGFHHFLSSWFFTDPSGRRILVDPGPASGIPALLKGLSSITDGVDLVLLTHIHIDHSGGVGQFCEAYPGAKVAAHPKAGRHLTSPDKLWKASLETLGDIAVMYGEPAPLAPEKLIERERLSGVEVLETPGHAPHHLSFIVPFGGQRLFFVGEAAGMRLPMDSPNRYSRPTSPPIFDLPAARRSLAIIEAAVRDDDLLCYAHYGAADEPKTQIAAAKKQLDEWLEIISENKDRPVDEIMDSLISGDRFLAGYPSLPEGLRFREAFFMKNSIAGFLGYISEGQ